MARPFENAHQPWRSRKFSLLIACYNGFVTGFVTPRGRRVIFPSHGCWDSGNIPYQVPSHLHLHAIQAPGPSVCRSGVVIQRPRGISSQERPTTSDMSAKTPNLLPEYQWLDAAGSVDYINNHSRRRVPRHGVPPTVLDNAPS
jgi:hypothetical protein